MTFCFYDINSRLCSTLYVTIFNVIVLSDRRVQEVILVNNLILIGSHPSSIFTAGGGKTPHHTVNVTNYSDSPAAQLNMETYLQRPSVATRCHHTRRNLQKMIHHERISTTLSPDRQIDTNMSGDGGENPFTNISFLRILLFIRPVKHLYFPNPEHFFIFSVKSI